MADLLERLKERTAPARQAARGPGYNYRQLWYAKPSGDVVRLQGDPQNRAYYEDKGYAVLRPDEEREWLETVRPRVVAAQRRKASLVTAIRRVLAKNPTVEILDDLDACTDAELESILSDVSGTAGPIKVVERRRPVDDEPAEPEPAEVGSGAALADKLERAEQRARSRNA